MFLSLCLWLVEGAERLLRVGGARERERPPVARAIRPSDLSYHHLWCPQHGLSTSRHRHLPASYHGQWPVSSAVAVFVRQYTRSASIIDHCPDKYYHVNIAGSHDKPDDSLFFRQLHYSYHDKEVFVNEDASHEYSTRRNVMSRRTPEPHFEKQQSPSPDTSQVWGENTVNSLFSVSFSLGFFFCWWGAEIKWS